MPDTGGCRAPKGSRAARMFEDAAADFLDAAAAGEHGDAWQECAAAYLVLREAGEVPPGTWAKVCRAVAEQESRRRVQAALAEHRARHHRCYPWGVS